MAVGGFWTALMRIALRIKALRPDCLHQALHRQDIHDALHVVSQDMQAHFGAHTLERPGQEVG